MVSIDDDRHIFKVSFAVAFIQREEILVVVVRHILTVVIDEATEDSVSERITLGKNFPASVEEFMGILSSNDRVEHNGYISACGVFHTDGDIHTAGGKSMLLILDRASTDSDVREQVGEVAVIFGIEHLIGTEETCFLDSLCVQVSDREQTCEQILGFLGVGLMSHSHISLACSAGLICIYSGYDYELVTDLFGDLSKARGIVKHSIFSVSRARADYEQHSVIFAAHNVSDLGITYFFLFCVFGFKRKLFFDFLGYREFSQKFQKIHLICIERKPKA